MAMDKKMESQGNWVIAGNSDQSKLFPVGFIYRIGTTVYTVIKKIAADNCEMRQIVTDRGDVEDVSVATLIKDFKSQPAGIEIQVIRDPDAEEAK